MRSGNDDGGGGDNVRIEMDLKQSEAITRRGERTRELGTCRVPEADAAFSQTAARILQHQDETAGERVCDGHRDRQASDLYE